MSRKSRRKTLSHAEIEDFLCDLGDDEVDLVSKRKSPSDVTISRDVSGKGSENKIEENFSCQTQTQEVEDRMYRAKVIRAFHKDMASLTESTPSPNIISYAKIIHEASDYPLLPTRQMFPENFPHPAKSLESKKALLVSMQPMLTAAEKQRKIDSSALENFTRCKVGKSRAKSSTYEYLDFDTNSRISGKEYSRRYLLFLTKKKAASVATDSVLNDITSNIDGQEQLKNYKSDTPVVLKEISLNVPSTSICKPTKQKDFILDSAKIVAQKTSPAETTLPNFSSADSEVDDFLMSFDDEDEDGHCSKSKSKSMSKNKKSGHNSTRSHRRNCRDISCDDSDETNSPISSFSSRRRTLSPASTKAILQQEMEDTLISGEKMDIEAESDSTTIAQTVTDACGEVETAPETNIESCGSESVVSGCTIVFSRKRNLMEDSNSHTEGELERDQSLLSPMKVHLRCDDNSVTNTDVDSMISEKKSVIECGIVCDEVVSDPFAGLLNDPTPHFPDCGIQVQRGSEVKMETFTGVGSASTGSGSEVDAVVEYPVECTTRSMEMGTEVDTSTEMNIEGRSPMATPLAQKQSQIDDSSGWQTEQSPSAQYEEEKEQRQELARERYEFRLEVAKWKYFWELASADAAHESQRRREIRP